MPETESFEDFHARTRPRMLARAILYSSDVGAAEEAVQDAYSAAEGKWEQVGAFDSPEGWVWNRVRWSLTNYRRGWLRRAKALPKPPSPGPDPAQVAWLNIVLAQLNRLPARRRQVLILHSLEGMTHKEIADLLGMDRKTVNTTITKARWQLRDRLGIPVDVIDAGSYALRDVTTDQLTVMLETAETMLCELIVAAMPKADLS